ncbi:MAG: CvpA family protein [Prevotellaceae bacterium]|jgi:membrane protein required for colicin V production|nr:CvpA family protein [Prevotellaceae bacterium]
MNIFDLTFALLLAWAILVGVRKGFVAQATSVFALLLGAYISYKFSYLLAKWITDFGVGGMAVQIISFSLTFIGVVLAARLLGSIVSRIVSLALMGWVNRLLGVIFSGAKMLLIISIVLVVVNSIDKELGFMPRQQVQQSKFYQPISNLAPSLLTFLNFDKIVKSAKDFDGKVDEKVESLK